MAFPLTQLPYHVEISPSATYGPGTWVDVTADVRSGTGVSVGCGRSSEDSSAQTSSLSLVLDNRTGAYSPDNPMSPYYPVLLRNTPIRVWLEQAEKYLDLDGVSGTCTTPDHASLDITGDIDIRWDGAPSSWGIGGHSTILVSKLADSTNNRSYVFVARLGGYLGLYWSTTGSDINLVASTRPVPFLSSHRGAVRVTFDVNNGSGGKTATFYTSDTIDGTWTQLGDAVTSTGTTSIYAGTAAVELGRCTDSTFFPSRQKVYAAQIRDGIGGTVVANPDFRAQATGGTSLTDSAGRAWTATSAAFANRDDRYSGEIEKLTPSADESGNDIVAELSATGILRRLEQGEEPLQSTIRRGELGVSSLVAYWPCEDLLGATSIASGLPGVPAMHSSGSALLESYTGFICSKPVVTTTSTTEFIGAVPSYSSTKHQVNFLAMIPTGTAAGQVVIAMSSTGNCDYWTLQYSSAGTLRLAGYDSSTGTIYMDTGYVAFSVNDKKLRISIELEQVGADIVGKIYTMEVGAPTGLVTTATATARTVGRISVVMVSPGGGMPGVALGHVSVYSDKVSIYDLVDQLVAFDGESASSRIARLCIEEGIEFVGTASDSSTLMGPQSTDAFTSIIRECEAADGGFLYEPKECVGIGYLTRPLIPRAASLVLPYTYLLNQVAPVYDDSTTLNDVEITRTGGGSAHVADETSLMGVQAVGRYSSAETINLYQEAQCEWVAAWRVHIGTVPGARYPGVSWSFAQLNILASPSITAALLRLGIGDRLDVSGPPAWAGPDNIHQLIIGYTEFLDDFEHTVRINSTPSFPYHVGVYGGQLYASNTATLSADITSSATTLAIVDTIVSRWTTNAGSYPFDIMIGGEQITLNSAPGGLTSPQTFTGVTRSVNGIVKAHSAGSAITLHDLAHYGM